MRKLLSITILALIIAGCAKSPEESCMAVEFTNVLKQHIGFTAPAVDNLTTISVSFWAYFDTLNTEDTVIDKWEASNTGWFIAGKTPNSLEFWQYFSGSDEASWRFTSAISTGAWHHIVIAYNNTSTSNDPIFYLDGSLDTTIEAVAPEPGGSAVLNTEKLELGGDANAAFDTTMDGKLQDVRIYNRILTATEIATLYNSRCQRVVLNGLVFWAPMNGANGIATFDGATLGATNYIIDEIGGARGVPAGNPIGRGNTIQRIY